MVFFVPLTLIIFLFFKLTDKTELFSRLKQSFFVLAGFFILYCICWYLPNQELFHYVMSEQTENRFPEFTGLLNQLNNNFRFIFLDEKIHLLTWIFGAIYIAGIIIFFSNSSSIYRKLFCSVSLWILFESHKMFMTYLPSRYLVSLLFANGFLASLILWEVLKEKRWESPVFRMPAIFLLVIITTYNAFTWYQTYYRRTWEMEKAEEYLLQYDFKGRHIAGAWATATAWKCKAITFPVWNDYFNYTNVLPTWQPVMVIAEDDEGDTGGAFISDGINLNQFADSIKTFQVNHWNLNFYWIKK